MKNLFTFCNLLIITITIHSKAFSQASSTSQKNIVVEGSVLQISKNKTSNIIFPYAIISVDRGSADILVQQVPGAENILQVKAAKEGFEESNLTVITADAKLYSFTVSYAKVPSQLNISFTETAGDAIPIQTLSNQNSLRPSSQSDMKTVSENVAAIVAKRNINWISKSTKDQIHLYLTGIYIKDDNVYLKILLRNRSNLTFDLDEFRFLVEDKKKLKRTASQEVTLSPIAMHGDIRRIPTKSENEFVIVLPKFTIPSGKYLNIEVNEVFGGRQISVKIRRQHIARGQLF